MTPRDSAGQLCGSPSWDAEQSFHVILILSTPRSSNPVCDDDSLWTQDLCPLSVNMASLCLPPPPPAIGSSLTDLGDRYLTDLNGAARNQVFRLGDASRLAIHTVAMLKQNRIPRAGSSHEVVDGRHWLATLMCAPEPTFLNL